MIKLNENYVVTPTGAKTLIIEEGDDWNKVCEKVVGSKFDYIFVPQEFEPAIFFRKFKENRQARYVLIRY